MAELSTRVTEATEIAEAFTIFAHRTDSAEWMIAGVRDSSGLDLGPNQACRLMVAQLCVSAAARQRKVSRGDAEFLHSMIGSFVPSAATFEDAIATTLRLQTLSSDPAHLDQVDQARVLFHEASIRAKADRDQEVATALGPRMTGLLDVFKSDWGSVELSQPITVAAKDPHDATHEPATRTEGSAYPPGSVRDRLTRWMDRTAARMDAKAERINEWNREQERKRGL